MPMNRSDRARSEPSSGGAQISVLVVDDEPEVVQLVEMLIERADKGLRLVGSATGGHEGLWLWEQLRPDVVVLDLSMPDLDGSEVAQRIRASAPEQAIVLFSSHIDVTSMTTESLRVPKTEMTELPELIHEWLSTRSGTGRCPGASPP